MCGENCTWMKSYEAQILQSVQRIDIKYVTDIYVR